jgi:hypothetical protein
MTTLAVFKSQVINLLGEDILEESDPIAGTITPAAVLEEGCRAGLIALSSRYWKSAVLEVDADATELEVESPADLISVEAFYDNTLAVFIPKILFQVGDSITGSQIQNSWYDYPSGTLSLTNPLTSGGKIYYSAHWALPTLSDEEEEASLDDFEIEAPNMCLNFLQLYAVSYCLLRKANEQGEIKQFATKVDSGTPLTIPAQLLSDFYMKRALAELQLLPMRQKGV